MKKVSTAKDELNINKKTELDNIEHKYSNVSNSLNAHQEKEIMAIKD